jgi:hypothetical protein
MTTTATRVEERCLEDPQHVLERVDQLREMTGRACNALAVPPT